MAGEGRSAFFYGTLMAPQVLHRVCHGGDEKYNSLDESHNFQTYPAILHDYRRQRVGGADFPAIVPHIGATVRGTYATGLTDRDIKCIDIFESSMYKRVKVKARLLSEVGDDDGDGNIEGEEVEAETYVWASDPEMLEDREWDFAEFQREKMHRWVGIGGEDEYAEVDEAVAAEEHDGTGGRGANGHITQALMESKGFEIEAEGS